MDVIFQSFTLVALSEMGDKTQLLALILAVRFKSRISVLAGILVATLLNHGLAATLGGALMQMVSLEWRNWILSALFIGIGLWLLKPDQEDDSTQQVDRGAFLTTLITFFLAEIGDKTQLATVALAAKYQSPLQVTFGTTLGMLFSDGLAVFFGRPLQERIPLKWIRWISAVAFIVTGLAIALGWGF